jgi:hypothetical protein
MLFIDKCGRSVLPRDPSTGLSACRGNAVRKQSSSNVPSEDWNGTPYFLRSHVPMYSAFART